MENLKTKKLNDKGFSLVELIIVIAIMAVLIGVLAPQYLRYVERSRESADLDTIDTLASAVQIYMADPANSVTTDAVLSCTGGSVDTTTDTTVQNALSDAGITGTPTMKSTAYQDWTITYALDGKITYGGTNGSALQTAMGY